MLACVACRAPKPGPESTPVGKSAWDALCPRAGASDAQSIVASEDVEFEPSGAAVIGDRVALLGDKQAALWWWRPGARDVMRDATFAIAGTTQTDPRSCCATGDAQPTPTWGTPIKREKAHETCDAHRVTRGAPLPWLKGEALAATTDTPPTIYVAGNMGFDCVDNEVRALASGTSTHVGGIDRKSVLAALGASDLRVEGFALADDGRTALVGVRQITRGPDADSRDVIMVKKVVVATRPDVSAPFAITHVSDIGARAESDGTADDRALSDLAVLPDGRVLVSVSVERTVGDGDTKVHEVGGAVLVTAPFPWRSAAAWTTTEIARFDDHKPEGVVVLTPTCTAVVFDDDEKVKKQARNKKNGGPEWASRAAFVRYVRLRAAP